MKLLALSTQTCSIKNTIILWTIDVDSKMLIKAYVNTQMTRGISVGDCIDVNIKTNGKRQEVFIEKINEVLSIESDIDEYLEMKAATPYSVVNPSFFGNIAKIEEIIDIEKNLVTAKLYGFPKEMFFLSISDNKWNSFWSSEAIDLKYVNKTVESVNKKKNKYIIIDFPYDEQKGYVAVAALVVR